LIIGRADIPPVPEALRRWIDAEAAIPVAGRLLE
jgi:hypothetical protein